MLKRYKSIFLLYRLIKMMLKIIMTSDETTSMSNEVAYPCGVFPWTMASEEYEAGALIMF